MQKIPLSSPVHTQSSTEVEKIHTQKDELPENTGYKKVSEKIHESKPQSINHANLKQVVTKEVKLLEKKLEEFLSDTLLKSHTSDDKLLTNKLYKDVSKIDNPQATIVNLHTQVLLQPWNYTVVDNEIYFRILSILNANLNSKDKNLSEEEILNAIQGKGKTKTKAKNPDSESINDDDKQNPNHNPKQDKNNKIKSKNKDSLDNLEGLAFIQWLSAISDEDTNELNNFLKRMRIFQPLEFFQRVQNISTNINLFVDPHGRIKVTNFHKDKTLIEQQLNERGRLRSHIWSMVGFSYKQGQVI